MKVLIGCEESGIIRDEFLRRGHNAWSCDLQPSSSPLGQARHLRCDVRTVWANGWDLMIIHPPCTYLAVLGNRWFGHPMHPNRERYRDEAVTFFKACMNASIPRICAENPVGTISTLYRKPDQLIEPWYFGHSETKKTGLWLKGLPKLVAKEYVKEEITRTDRIHHLFHEISNKKELSRIRSQTYRGIAMAMADQWGGLLAAPPPVQPPDNGPGPAAR